jgi:cytochrome c553
MKPTTMLSALAVLLLGALGSAAAADIEAGKAKAAVCSNCHGANGEGAGQNPPLAGMAEGRFVQAMKDYKSGKRPHAMMKGFASKLDDAETVNVAAYFASLKKK